MVFQPGLSRRRRDADRGRYDRDLKCARCEDCDYEKLICRASFSMSSEVINKDGFNFKNWMNINYSARNLDQPYRV